MGTTKPKLWAATLDDPISGRETTILARSSNVGVTKLAMSLPAEHLWTTMTRFGLGALTALGGLYLASA